MSTNLILNELAANDGAILCWQASDEAAFAAAAARGVIRFDEDADCFVHPDAIKVADGAFQMPFARAFAEANP